MITGKFNETTLQGADKYLIKVKKQQFWLVSSLNTTLGCLIYTKFPQHDTYTHW